MRTFVYCMNQKTHVLVCSMLLIGAGLLQPHGLRLLDGPIRHPQDYSQLKLGTAVYGNLRDFLIKVTRSLTITC